MTDVGLVKEPRMSLTIPEILARIEQVAVAGRTEEDLKMTMEPLIRDYATEIGIEVDPRYEQVTGLRGYRDSVYGHLSVEYKRPGLLAGDKNVERAAQQLVDYLEAAARDFRGDREEALKRVAGISTDGQKIFFLRYWPIELSYGRPVIQMRQLGLFEVPEAAGGFQMLGPMPLTSESLDLLFLYIRALKRKPLSAEFLAEEFGPKSESAISFVGQAYSALVTSKSGIVSALSDQWKSTFGIVYKQTKKAKEDIQEIAEGYGIPQDADLEAALFSIHTYFALIMKFLAAEILSLQQGAMSQSVISELPGLSSQDLLDQMKNLEHGWVFNSQGVKNFLEGDYFKWYLSCWNDDLASSIRKMATALMGFEPTTPTLRPEKARDLLKKLYQYLVPKKLRHDLGEYYTPDWIAERLLNQLGFSGNPDVRLLDPACGSGTFLTLAINRVREHMTEFFYDRDPVKRRECARKILDNIVGFDLNPLAVIAARTNYLLAFGDLIRDVRPIRIPVFLCDSILTPALQQEAQREQKNLLSQNIDHYYLPTSVGDFMIPKEVLDKRVLDQLTELIEVCVDSGCSPEDFSIRLQNVVALGEEGAHEMVNQLYQRIIQLEEEGRNGIWAQLIENSFAPVLQEPFDLIAGNPPWVRWESLPGEWKKRTKDMWTNYGLFSLDPSAARLGGGKKDLSMLFTYVCSDQYLKMGGKLGFVITQTVFKSGGTGDGFRRFELQNKDVPLGIIHVDDMTRLNPFDNAQNRTAVMILEKGKSTKYPVPYTLWRKKGSGRIPVDSVLKQVTEHVERSELKAVPVDTNRPSSPWLTAHFNMIKTMRKVIGESTYKAEEGTNTLGLNGVFWVTVDSRRPDGLVVITNMHDCGDNKVVKVTKEVEDDLLYPLLRGRDIDRWVTTPSAGILLTQDGLAPFPLTP